MSGIDTASQQFLHYAIEQSKDHHETDARGRRWVMFEQLFQPSVHSKQVAAQAFLHILSLATNKAVSVRQEDAELAIPFGAIHIGLPDVSAD